MKQFEYGQKKKQLERLNKLIDAISEEAHGLHEDAEGCYTGRTVTEGNEVYNKVFDKTQTAFVDALQVFAQRAHDLKGELGLL